jgi:hypothetical protein
MGTIELRYDENYAVELFDHVEVRIGGLTFDGEITGLYPRKGMVRVRYLDTLDFRKDGEPKRKPARVPVGDVDLIGRDA